MTPASLVAFILSGCTGFAYLTTRSPFVLLLGVIAYTVLLVWTVVRHLTTSHSRSDVSGCPQ